MIRFILFIIAFLIFSSSLYCQTDQKKKLIYIFNIKEEIGPAIWRKTQKAFAEARQLDADIILIHMNTYGGLVDAADSIRTKILNTEIPVYVFIDNNAASAGALISIACDRIYMRKGGNIGAATVVDQTGQAVPDKYQSFMRSTMRSTAEFHGKDTLITETDTIVKWRRDPKIAEAMVDPSIYIENVIDSGKVLTFTTNEAVKNGYCEGIAENIQEVIDQAGIENYELKEYVPGVLESFIGFLVNPFVHGILIMIIFAGIYFELQTPGIGFPLAAAVVAALLYFAPLYLEGLAANWEILIFIAGIILIILEIFVIPGFGVAGISGIVLAISGLTLSMVDNVIFDFQQPEIAVEKVFKSLMITCVSMLTSFLLSIFLSQKLFSSRKYSFALNTTQQVEDGFVSIDLKQKDLKGKAGVATTMLRPSGKVEIDDNEYDAMAINSYIEKGEKVYVVKDEAGQVYVKKI